MSADRKDGFHIHTGVHVVSARVGGISVHKNVSDADYSRYRDGEITFQQLIAIEETSVRTSILGSGEVDWNISDRNSNGLNITSARASTISSGGGADAEVSKGKDAVTKSAKRYANEYGSQNPPSLLERAGHLLGTVMGSSSLSAQYYGPDGSKIPVPKEVQSTVRKAVEIDKGRRSAHDEMRRRVLSQDPNAIFSSESNYSGLEVKKSVFEDSPSNNPNVHISGSAFGRQTVTTAHDGTSGKVAHDTGEIADKTGLSWFESRQLANNSVIDYKNDKIVRVIPTESIERPSGGISYSIGGKTVDRDEWNESRGKRR
jgi:hypothetical protein